MLHLKSAKLARWQVRLIVTSGVFLWLSGAVWLWLHYFGQKEGDFGPEINPLEPWMLRLHGAAMQVALIALGTLLVVHVWRGWGYRSQRVVGSLLVALIAALILTGYGLYYFGDDTWRPLVSLLHWGVGLAILPIFLMHYTSGRRLGAFRSKKTSKSIAE